ncbi:pilus assembly protein CpaC [Breoghania corrubedonensis]|uniref:Pilus assembly protein CpaC n=1 Tax=Breoghania corrubedonensis TaxID=665038 RepID=A0A2T5VG25_9HYPH|nr:type II and III secretion system protein family protein [Breoghania corrubedonensis]PTW62709.1 pilus assembly protein CpaC [Breoghania corrubedonensis]
MVRGALLKGLLVALGLAMAGLIATGAPADAGNAFPKKVRIAAGQGTMAAPLSVGIGRSVVVETGDAVADVMVSDPTIADAVVRTPHRVFVLGVKAGQANLFLFGAGGRQIASLDLTVAQDTSELNNLITRLVPGSNVHVEVANNAIILSGTVLTPLDSQKAIEIAKGYSGSGDGDKSNVINMLNVMGKEQVFLKVTIAEVERTLVKRLGINFDSVSIGTGAYSLGYTGFNSTLLDTAEASLGFSKGSTSIQAKLQALQEDGVVRTLAEPTLTAISGENASFLVGGEYPIPVAQDNNKISIEFKPFGVGLDFTPIVLSGGRISLRVKTEVSELTSDGSIDISGLTIQALKVRRAESTVELPSGGALVMAGLLRDNFEDTLKSVPGLAKLPILGALFKSRDYQRNQTELVVFVTPYIVKPTSPAKLARPDKNLAPASDAESLFFDRLNRVYRADPAAPTGSYQGQVGFIYE